MEAELKGFPVNVMHLQDYGVPVYDELVFIVHEDSVQSKKDLLQRFLRAVARGHQFAARNPDAAADAVKEANEAMGRELIVQGVRLLAPLWAEMEPFGLMDEAKWQAFVDFLFENGVLENRVPVDTLMTNELIPR